MATRNPRVNVCVTNEQHALLARLAVLQGRSAASLINAMIDAAEPLMRRTVAMLELAEDANGQSREAAREALRSVLEELQALSGDTDQLDLLKLLPEAPSGDPAALPAQSGATEESAAAPPSSNTGVRSRRPKAHQVAPR